MVAEKTDKKQYLEHIIQNIPHKPGVYKMKDETGTIMYVGKARDLKNRVSSYFQQSKDKMMRTLKMVEQICDIEYAEVGSDLEALLLETNLIKELRPKYNILMKDDKSYVYVKITVQEEYPKIYLVRKVLKDKARYFGPKTAAWKVIRTLKLLRSIFPFRHCQLAMNFNISTDGKTGKELNQKQLEYHQLHCLGPCILSVEAGEYRKMVQQVIEFLEGKHEEILKKLKEDMARAAAERKFEVAAAIRDKLRIVEEIVESQRISDPHQKDLDIINYVEQDEKMYVNLFQLRGGKLIDQENFVLKAEQNGIDGENREGLGAFLEQYYEKTTDIPKEILIPHEVDDAETLSAWLSEMKGSKVEICVPERGKKNQLLELSLANAQSFARQSMVKWQGEEKGNRDQALTDLQKLLELPTVPIRLECYDISHFSGTETVGSMVVFEHGFPKKDDYRKFKLHQQTGGEPNDFASMEETLTRRLKYLKPSKAPDDWQLRKATKKDLKELGFAVEEKKREAKVTAKKKKEKKDTEKSLPAQEYVIFVLEKKQKIQGHIALSIKPNKKALIETIKAETTFPLLEMIKKICEKVKVKRIYLCSKNTEQSTYEEVGFQMVKKIPDGFACAPDEAILVYDCKKYKDDSSFKKKPDLLIIDGGKGQLSSAMKALEKYQLNIPIISIAKKEEELFVPGKSESIRLPKDNPLSLLIQHIRNEAHRFAVSYHQNLRLKATTESTLDGIYGLGPETKVRLLKHFGSVENLQQAPLEKIAVITGTKLAHKIKENLIEVHDT